MRHSVHVQLYFDHDSRAWADLYARPETANDHVLIERNKIAVAFLRERLPPGSRLLDAGCGAGVASVELARLGYRVDGVDFSPRMIELASRLLAAEPGLAPLCRFAAADALPKDAAGAPYDGALALGFLEYQEDERETLRRLRARLRPGGFLLVTGPQSRRLSNLFGLGGAWHRFKSAGAALARRARGGAPDESGPSRLSLHEYSLARFESLLAASGFEIAAHRGHGYANFSFLGAGAASRRAEFALQKSLDALGRTLPLERFANDLVVAARAV